ncbi:hypothetical protein MOMOMM089B2_18445 [Morganella morganii]
MKNSISSWGIILLCLLTWTADIIIIYGETVV